MLHTALGTYGYYKGTSIHCIYKDEAGYVKKCSDAANTLITILLRSGKNLKFIGERTKERMDELEEYLCQAPDSKRTVEFSGKDYLDYLSNASGGKHSGEEFAFLWYVNMTVLLKLKVIDNDEMNGWLIMKQK